METNRLLSRQFEGGNAHLTRRDFFDAAATFTSCERGTIEELKGLVLTCAVLLSVAMLKTQINCEETCESYPFDYAELPYLPLKIPCLTISLGLC